MNRTTNTFTTLAALLILLITGAGDAGATVYTWSRYNLSFETPENGFVTFNSLLRTFTSLI